MNLFELFVKIGVDDQASDKISSLSSKLGNGLATAAKIGTAAVGVAAAGITALTKTAVNNYAEYEQLVGGTELLFGDAFDFVQEKASEAYKNVQMSQSEYLKQVNGFATGLKTALGGNSQAAAELADRIITAEADIVAATGASQEMVQNAFNGIMRSNYVMLDNLQLGIKPTKEGFQEVIDIVNKWNAEQGKATDYQIDNLADAQSALLDYIEMQGISGYAAMEASNTISGSIASVKSAWTNLVTGISDDNANVSQLIDNLIDSAVVAAGNLLPRIEKTLTGIGELIDGLAPVVIDALPGLISNVLPPLLDTGLSLLMGIIDGITNNFDSLLDTAFQVIDMLLNGIIDNLPRIIEMGVQLIGKLAVGIVQAIPDLVMKVPEIISAIVNGFSASFDDIVSIGENIVKGIWDGISSMASWITEKVSGFFGGIVDSAKSVLGIHSPSTVFAGIGGFMAEGLGEGWEDKYGSIKRGIQNDLRFQTATVDFASSGFGISSAGIINSASKNGYSGNSFPSTIELRLSSNDGQMFGRWLVPFVRSENRSNPEVVSDT